MSRAKRTNSYTNFISIEVVSCGATKTGVVDPTHATGRGRFWDGSIDGNNAGSVG
jgi:hypothetical protein